MTTTNEEEKAEEEKTTVPQQQYQQQQPQQQQQQQRPKNLNDVITAVALQALISHQNNANNNNQQYYDQHTSYYTSTSIPTPTTMSTTIQQLSSILYEKFISTCKHILRLLFIIICMLFISTILYVILYNNIIPRENSITKPIFFDYNNHFCYDEKEVIRDEGKGEKGEKGGGAGNNINDQQHQQHQQHQQKLCPPTAIIDLSSVHTQWKAHYSQIAPQPLSTTNSLSTIPPPQITSSSSSSISKGIPYYIHLKLTLPESQINQHIGVFMVEMKIKNSKNVILATSNRPVLLTYYSDYITYWKKFIGLLFYVIGLRTEYQVLSVYCFDHFLHGGSNSSNRDNIDTMAESNNHNNDDSSNNNNSDNEEDYYMSSIEIRLITPSANVNSLYPSSTMTTTYHSPSYHQHQYQHYPQHTFTTSTMITPTSLQISKAELQIGKELNKVQFVMKEWFYTCALCFILLSMIGQVIIYYLYRFLVWVIDRMGRGSSDNNNGDEKYVNIYNHDDDSSSVDYVILDNDEGVNDFRTNANNDNNDFHDTSSEQWIPFADEINLKNSNETPDHISVDESEVKDDSIDEASRNKSFSPQREKIAAPSPKRKARKISKDKRKTMVKMTNLEREKVDRIMKGDLAPYEIFTGK